uniref:Imidazolonepropionase n=1 Tax=candidate division WOR-3 bacterium TaxID=2052148 RepID=A0A7C4TCM0_UNCW3
MAILIKNATQVLKMSNGIDLMEGCSILIDDGVIKKIGRIDKSEGEVIDATGCVVTPGLVDSHTHLVFAGTREDEFAARIEGKEYEEIAREGGGILKTVRETRNATEEELYQTAKERIKNLIRHGTTTVEIKSGYGLIPDDELKILRVIKRLKETSPIEIIPTLLIHTIPPEMKRKEYIDLVNEKLIPGVAKEKLAQFCDIFCDRTAFTRSETRRVLHRAREFGFKLKIHADELSHSGGAALASEMKCISAEHLIWTTKSEINLMEKANVVPVLLPGTSLFLKTRRKPQVKSFLEKKLPVAIASDFNPGTCLIYAMPKIISLACLLYQMPIESALIGATVNGARAIGLESQIGIIEPGRQADLVIWNVDKYKKIPYQFGEDIIRTVIKKGRIIYDTNC